MAAPAAPVQFSNILGSQGAPGPQAPPAPWKQWGDHISYLKGTVVGEPDGDNMGDGSMNAEALYINGKSLRHFDDSEFVSRAGDSMEGSLLLAADPVEDLEAATKQYVDREVLTIGVPDILPTPPENPVPGQLWFDPESLQLYIWYTDGDSAQWVVTINQAPYVPVLPPLDYLPLEGGTLTGPVIGPLGHFDAIIGDHLIANADPAAADAAFWGSNDGMMRWRMTVAYPQSETGGEVGSNLTIDRYTDAGGYISTPFSINRKTGKTTLGGALDVGGGIVMKSGGGFVIDASATSYKHMAAQTDGKNRWIWGATGDDAAGGEFFINAYDDAGDFNKTPLTIARDTGHITLLAGSVSAAPVNPADVARKHEVDALRNLITGDLEVSSVPVGGIIIWPTDEIPPNYLVCNGGHYYPADAPLLFAKLGGRYFWDGVTFGVPNMADRTVIGAWSWGLGAMGGEANHTLSEGEMPWHGHGIYDPTHAHSVYDPSHNHGWNDPGHAHSIADGGHQHWFQISGSFGYMPGTANIGINPFVNVSASAYWTDVRGTGIGIYGAGCGAWNSAAGVGIGIYGAATGQSIYGAGGGATHNNMQPFIAQYYIIRYR